MRRAALLTAVACLAVLAAAAALARVGAEPGARAEAIAAAGAFEIDNSREGQPVFAAAGIGPGDSARGTVEIAATGSVPVALTLSRHDLLDAPGLGGGLLSAALSLTVTDVTDPAAPRAVYAGPLDSMPERPVGRIRSGASRTYSFVATLPAASAGGQNALQGASVSVAYAWTAIEAEPEEPGSGAEDPGEGEGGAEGPSAPSPAAGETPITGAATLGPVPRGALELKLNRAARALRGGRLVLWAGCGSACAIVAKGRLRASAGGHHRGAKVRFGGPARYRAGTQKLRIRVPGGLRRWLAAASGKRRLRARLLLTANDPGGASAKVRRTLALKPPRRR